MPVKPCGASVFPGGLCNSVLPILELRRVIAATALVHGMTIVTRNTADFELTGVQILNPWTWRGLSSKACFELPMQCPTTRNSQFDFFCPETLRASLQT